MGLFSTSLSLDVISVLVALIAVFVAYSKWRFTYWSKRGVETPPPSLPFGTSRSSVLGRMTFGEHYRSIYSEFKAKGLKHCGSYSVTKPGYIPIDLDVIKQILVKDFQHFVNHGVVLVDQKVDPLAGTLFNLEDAKWRHMRVKLTPTFTSGKMKMMFQTLADCTGGLKDLMASCAAGKEPADVKEILARFTTDVIGSCAFGLELNTLNDPDSEFRKFSKRVFEFTRWERIKAVTKLALLPQIILQALKLKLTKPDVEQFFLKVVKDTVEYRENSNVRRNDFMQLLIQLRNKSAAADGDTGVQNLTMPELSAQAFIFFTAGFETSSTTMAFALYELATNPQIQDKLRQEVKEVLAKHNDRLTYDCVMEMEYLEKVIYETLRMYPPVSVLPRVCTMDYVVPGTGLTIEKGTSVKIPILGLHYDAEYFPDPEKFDPERFSEENKSKRHPFAWLPFGEGPRMCIGLRFAMLQSKIGLATVVKDFRITVNKKTGVPLKLDPFKFITSVKGGVWLDVEKIN